MNSFNIVVEFFCYVVETDDGKMELDVGCGGTHLFCELERRVFYVSQIDREEDANPLSHQNKHAFALLCYKYPHQSNAMI